MSSSAFKLNGNVLELAVSDEILARVEDAGDESMSELIQAMGNGEFSDSRWTSLCLDLRQVRNINFNGLQFLLRLVREADRRKAAVNARVIFDSNVYRMIKFIRLDLSFAGVDAS